MVRTKANATIALKFINPNPTVGATNIILTIIDPKQHGHGATIAMHVAAVVFLSNTLYSRIVNIPAKIIITAIIKKNSKL